MPEPEGPRYKWKYGKFSIFVGFIAVLFRLSQPIGRGDLVPVLVSLLLVWLFVTLAYYVGSNVIAMMFRPAPIGRAAGSFVREFKKGLRGDENTTKLGTATGYFVSEFKKGMFGDEKPKD